MRSADTSGRPKLVYELSSEQAHAIADYYFYKRETKTLRQLATVLKLSVQGASNVSLRVLGQWAENGRLMMNPDFHATLQ
jgi:hypothetical protein